MPHPDEENGNHHGTRCAGEIAAVSNNSFCAVGVAFGSRIAGAAPAQFCRGEGQVLGDAGNVLGRQEGDAAEGTEGVAPSCTKGKEKGSAPFSSQALKETGTFKTALILSMQP